MGYGLTAELQLKKDAKYDPEMEQDALMWMEAVLDRPGIFEGVSGKDAVHQALMDGVILCELINIIQPGSVKKINKQQMPFMKMENIGNFLDACVKYGLMKTDLFQTVDLYEKQNMASVIQGIHALGRKAQRKGYSGPTLGPKESDQNMRDFTDEQLRAGQGVIGLQMGTNKVANASGINYGKSRGITDIH